MFLRMLPGIGDIFITSEIILNDIGEIGLNAGELILFDIGKIGRSQTQNQNKTKG